MAISPGEERETVGGVDAPEDGVGPAFGQALEEELEAVLEGKRCRLHGEAGGYGGGEEMRVDEGLHRWSCRVHESFHVAPAIILISRRSIDGNRERDRRIG